MAARGEGEGREVKVHYKGYKKTQDVWILASSARMRGCVAQLDLLPPSRQK